MYNRHKQAFVAMTVKQKSLGFTMIEMLVSIAIVITSATIVVAIITATFRSSNTSSSQEKLRQAGTAALSQTTGMIRFADSFDGAYDLTKGNYVPHINSSGQQACETPDSDSSPSVDAIRITSGAVQRVIACTDSNTLTLDDQDLIDPANVTTTKCDISCTQTSSADSPVITISLSLSTASSNPDQTLQENNAGIYELSQSVRMANPSQ